ncbi:MAG: hypothetical protein CSA66_03735 [Proteobacteria bacterium]|nr:MAG: hypothetical protein CSA66_03735 [Pseudomonadota bacterium]
MSDGAPFQRRFDRHGLSRTKRGLVTLVLAVAMGLGVASAATWAVAGGVFFPAAPKTEPAPRTHAVRTHGWGGYYIGPGAGRSHFGGGGRIH